jgi:hypothetical protein
MPGVRDRYQASHTAIIYAPAPRGTWPEKPRTLRIRTATCYDEIGKSDSRPRKL